MVWQNIKMVALGKLVVRGFLVLRLVPWSEFLHLADVSDMLSLFRCDYVQVLVTFLDDFVRSSPSFGKFHLWVGHQKETMFSLFKTLASFLVVGIFHS